MTKFASEYGMVLIGLISDTHIPEAMRYLPEQIKEAFKGVDLILHAGDLYVTGVLDELERIAPVLAAQGDDEYPDTENDERVREKHVIAVGAVTIWLKHIMWWWPENPEERLKLIKGDQEKVPDIVVYGHSHRAKVENKGGSLLVNPGSPTFPEYRYELGTVALLTLNSNKADVQIIPLR